MPDGCCNPRRAFLPFDVVYLPKASMTLSMRPCQFQAQFVLALSWLCLALSGARGQDEVFQSPAEPWKEPIMSPDLRLEAPRAESYSVERPGRFPLFRMPTGFVSEPVGVDAGDDPPVDGVSFSQTSPAEDRFQAALLSDNPFFDFRSRGDPGGPGYYRLYAQYQLFEGKRTDLCMVCRAVTPAGLESDGLAHGPTVITPSLAWYQELGDNTALHGFIGKHFRAGSQWTDHLEHSFQYGVAVQRPIPGLNSSTGNSFHLFLEALGRQRNNPDLGDRPAATWEVLPGVHWRWGDNCWMSGGLIFPLNGPHPDTGLWQITWKWRF